MPISDRIKPKKVNEPVTTNQDELNGFIDFDDDLPIIVGQLTPNDLNLGGILTIGEKGADGYSPWVEFEPIESSELSGNKVIIHYHDDYGIERKVEFDVWDGNGISSITQEEDSEGYYHLHIILDNGTEITTDRISGLSAYEVAVNNGFIGTEEEWLASLKGEKGDTGPEGPQGPQGEQGEQGIQGEPGPYYIPSVDENGNISWEATSSELPIPEAVNIKGGIYVPELSSEGIIWVYFPDADSSDRPTSIPLSDITGPQGEQGDTGPQGRQGNYYRPNYNPQTGEITFIRQSPETGEATYGPWLIKGSKGDKGDTGDKGDKGDQGIQGEKGETGGHYIPKVIEISQGKFIVWEWTPESSETSEIPTDINLEELRGPKGDKGDQGPVGTTITSIEPVESSSGATFGVYGIDHDSSEPRLINEFEFDLGQIIWDCGDSTTVMPPEWDEPEGEV